MHVLKQLNSSFYTFPASITYKMELIVLRSTFFFESYHHVLTTWKIRLRNIYSNMHQIKRYHRIQIPVLEQLDSSFYTFHVSIARSCHRNMFFSESYYSLSVKYLRHQKYVCAANTLNMSQIKNYHRIRMRALRQLFFLFYAFPVAITRTCRMNDYGIYSILHLYIYRRSHFQLYALLSVMHEMIIPGFNNFRKV